MNFDNHRPIYLQIIDLIKNDIMIGKINPGDKLMSVRDYAKEVKVNPNTVQKSYQEMERLNLAYTQRGIGRFIVEDDGLVQRLKVEMSSKVVEDFVLKMRGMNYSKEEIVQLVEQAIGGESCKR